MTARRPAILVATSLVSTGDRAAPYAVQLPEGYVAAVVAAGGLPVLVPPMADGPAWRRLVATGDALLVVGGHDIDPAVYGERPHPKTQILPAARQQADARILAWAERRRLPMMGVCLGIQSLTVHRGGTLIQDIPDQWPRAVKHSCPAGRPWPRHEVRIDPDSRLARIIGDVRLSTNSHHHQAVREPGRRLRAVAWSADSLIEAVEDERPDRFVLGIQWHPERLIDEPAHLALFRALVRAARRR